MASSFVLVSFLEKSIRSLPAAVAHALDMCIFDILLIMMDANDIVCLLKKIHFHDGVVKLL